MTNPPYGQPDPPQYPPPQYPSPQYPPPQYPPPQYPPDAYPPPQYPPGQPQQYGEAYRGQQYAGAYGGGTGEPPPGWPPPPAPAPRRRRGLVIGLVAGGIALVLCLAGIAVVALRVIDTASDPAGSDDPFAGSPAATFAEGADGIQMPGAEAVGDFSAAEVADALAQVEQALVATRMDTAMLVERDPEPFLALMAEDNRPTLRDEFESAGFSYFASQLADGAELAVPVPRVQGEVTYEATLDEGGFRVIEVVTSFVWAYAFVVPTEHPDLDGIVVVRDELVWQVAHPDDVADSSLGLWLWEGEAYAWGIDCTAFAQGLLSPQTDPGPASGGPDDEDEIFDPTGSLDLPDTC